MKSILRLGVIFAAIAFFFSITAVETNAQWSRNRNRSFGNQNRQYPNRQWQQRRSRISPQEYRRLSRQRSRIYQSRQRAYRDGNINRNERRRIIRQTQRYRQNVRRDRRDRN